MHCCNVLVSHFLLLTNDISAHTSGHIAHPIPLPPSYLPTWIMPPIIFIDEIDAVDRQCGDGYDAGNDEREQTVNQILIEMDNFEGVITIAATSCVNILDQVVLRQIPNDDN
jgi:hypothetical protein